MEAEGEEEIKRLVGSLREEKKVRFLLRSLSCYSYCAQRSIPFVGAAQAASHAKASTCFLVLLCVDGLGKLSCRTVSAVVQAA